MATDLIEESTEQGDRGTSAGLPIQPLDFSETLADKATLPLTTHQ